MEDPAYRLVMLIGPDSGAEYPLSEETIRLGRDESNDIVINDPEVSRQHARIRRTERGFILEDVGSTNGTFVNDGMLSEPHLLSHGDRIGLSDHITLVFEDLNAEVALTQATPAIKDGTAPHERVQARRGRRRANETGRAGLMPWAYAGCGCAVFLVGLAAVLYWMPTSWWCIILSPLETIGLSFGGC